MSKKSQNIISYLEYDIQIGKFLIAISVSPIIILFAKIDFDYQFTSSTSSYVILIAIICLSISTVILGIRIFISKFRLLEIKKHEIQSESDDELDKVSLAKFDEKYFDSGYPAVIYLICIVAGYLCIIIFIAVSFGFFSTAQGHSQSRALVPLALPTEPVKNSSLDRSLASQSDIFVPHPSVFFGEPSFPKHKHHRRQRVSG